MAGGGGVKGPWRRSDGPSQLHEQSREGSIAHSSATHGLVHAPRRMVAARQSVPYSNYDFNFTEND
jgi:hypothetical protein